MLEACAQAVAKLRKAFGQIAGFYTKSTKAYGFVVGRTFFVHKKDTGFFNFQPTFAPLVYPQKPLYEPFNAHIPLALMRLLI